MKLRASRCRAMMRLTAMSSSRGDVVLPGQRQHEPLELRHVEARRPAPLPDDVGDEHAEHGRRRPGGSRSSRRPPRAPARRYADDAQPGHGQRPLRQQRHLDLARRRAAPARAAPSRATSRSRRRDSPVIALNDSASSPSWSRARTGMHVREVAVAQVLGAGEQLVHGAGDRPRQREADHERHDLDDQEQPADDAQQREQHAARSSCSPTLADAAESRS